MAQIKQLDTMLEQVKSAHAGLKKDLELTNNEIKRLENENAALPQLTASFEDIKQGILDLIDEAGERYLQGTIKAQLITFATGGLSGMRLREKPQSPLTLGELDGAVNGTLWPEARAQLITPMKGQFDDLALYAVFGDALKANLTKALETLTPTDFGFGFVRQDQIGPTRSEMNARIAENNQEITRLKAHRASIQQELSKFGLR
jgi:hypothetical protein